MSSLSETWRPRIRNRAGHPLLALLVVTAAGCNVPLGIADWCGRDADCDDGLFCNGAESCLVIFCMSGTPPCPPVGDCEPCNEDSDACVPICADDADCDDGLFCNGLETCDGCSCLAGMPPCSGTLACPPDCDESGDVCTVGGCDSDHDCDDGLFCNGVETCENCGCFRGDAPCGPAIENCDPCDELTNSCLSPCQTELDCDDSDPCTLNRCGDCGCVHRSRGCDEGYSCNPATGQCENEDGPALCLADHEFCPPDQLPDYDALLQGSDDFPRCDAAYYANWTIAGQCDEGTLFVHISDGMHEQIHYFDAQNGEFLAWEFRSDGIDCNCLGITYCPVPFNCGDGIVTEVVCGDWFAIGDSAGIRERAESRGWLLEVWGCTR